MKEVHERERLIERLHDKNKNVNAMKQITYKIYKKRKQKIKKNKIKGNRKTSPFKGATENPQTDFKIRKKYPVRQVDYYIRKFDDQPIMEG